MSEPWSSQSFGLSGVGAQFNAALRYALNLHDNLIRAEQCFLIGDLLSWFKYLSIVHRAIKFKLTPAQDHALAAHLAGLYPLIAAYHHAKTAHGPWPTALTLQLNQALAEYENLLRADADACKLLIPMKGFDPRMAGT